MYDHQSTTTKKLAEAMSRSAGSMPVVTLTTAAVATVLGLAPDWSAAMSYQREAIATGQIWRLISGHLTHWNADHLLWDVVAFVVLSLIIEQRRRTSVVRLLIGSGIAISLSLWYFGNVGEYRGLSGVDSALFVYVAIELARDALALHRHVLSGFAGLLLVGFVGKIAYEITTGATLFVDSRSDGFTPLPLIHMVGAAVGLACAAVDGHRRVGARRLLPPAVSATGHQPVQA